MGGVLLFSIESSSEENQLVDKIHLKETTYICGQRHLVHLLVASRQKRKEKTVKTTAAATYEERKKKVNY